MADVPNPAAPPMGAPKSPVPNQNSFMQRKVFGVRVLYLVAGAVVILAVWAWRMRTTNVTATLDTGVGTDTTETTSDTLPILPTGTVIAESPAAVVSPSGGIQSNDDWLRAAVAYLITHGSNPGSAQRAMQNYLAGEDLTYAEGVMRDSVIREYGLPPDIGNAGSGTTGTVPKPAPKIPPPPVTPPKKPPVIVKPPPKPAPKPAPYHRPYPGHYIQSGSRGADVVAVQRIVHVTPDGKFGPITRAAVIRYQRSHGLQADGIVGPLTWKKMFG